MRFGEWLRSEREKQGLLAHELADKVGFTPSKLSRIENMKANATFSVVVPVCEVLGVNVDRLFLELSEGSYQPPSPKPTNTEPPVCLTESLALRFLNVVVGSSREDAIELLGQIWWSLETSGLNPHKRLYGPPYGAAE